MLVGDVVVAVDSLVERGRVSEEERSSIALPEKLDVVLSLRHVESKKHFK